MISNTARGITQSFFYCITALTYSLKNYTKALSSILFRVAGVVDMTELCPASRLLIFFLTFKMRFEFKI